MDDNIAGCAMAVLSCAGWQFIPTGTFRVGEHPTESHTGELFYMDRAFRTGPAIQAHTWAFCLMRAGVDEVEHWFLAGFHGAQRFHFGGFAPTKDMALLRKVFIGKVVDLFWPILYPAVPVTDAPIYINGAVPNEERVAMLKKYSLSGAGIEPVAENLERMARLEHRLSENVDIPLLLFSLFGERLRASGKHYATILFASSKRLEEWIERGDCSMPVLLLLDAEVPEQALRAYPKTVAATKETGGYMILVATRLTDSILHTWSATCFQPNAAPAEHLRSKYTKQFELKGEER